MIHSSSRKKIGRNWKIGTQVFLVGRPLNCLKSLWPNLLQNDQTIEKILEYVPRGLLVNLETRVNTHWLLMNYFF